MFFRRIEIDSPLSDMVPVAVKTIRKLGFFRKSYTYDFHDPKRYEKAMRIASPGTRVISCVGLN